MDGHDGDMHHAVDEVIDVAFGGRRDLEDPLDGIAGGVGRRFLLISIIVSFLVLVLVLLSLSFLFFSLFLLFQLSNAGSKSGPEFSSCEGMVFLNVGFPGEEVRFEKREIIEKGVVDTKHVSSVKDGGREAHCELEELGVAGEFFAKEESVGGASGNLEGCVPHADCFPRRAVTNLPAESSFCFILWSNVNNAGLVMILAVRTYNQIWKARSCSRALSY